MQKKNFAQVVRSCSMLLCLLVAYACGDSKSDEPGGSSGRSPGSGGTAGRTGGTAGSSGRNGSAGSAAANAGGTNAGGSSNGGSTGARAGNGSDAAGEGGTGEAGGETGNAGDGAGGSAGGAGSGGNGGIPTVDCEPGSSVFEEGFEDAPDVGSEWVVDNAAGVHEGTAAAHPTMIKAGHSQTMSFSCGGKRHSQLVFWLSQTVDVSASTLTLALSVDDEARETLARTFGWNRYVIDVPYGKHDYTFEAASTVDLDEPFVIDSIQCVEAPEPCENPAQITFDDDQVPPEMGAVEDEPGWLVDNTRGIHDDGTHEASEAAARAPALKANKTAAMTIQCDGEDQTQLVFWLTQTVDVSASQLYLDFLVDGQLRETFARTFGWNRYVIDVPRGHEHVYTFRAHATVDLATSFVIDTVSCVDDQQGVDPDMRVYFDKNSVPPEMGEVDDEPGWFVDNTRGIHDDGTHEASEAAARAPALKANKTAAMTLDCGDETHTQLVFWLTQTIDVSASQLSLDFLVDGELRETFARTFGWNRYVIDVPRGKHEYTFRAHATVDLATSFVIDTVSCVDDQQDEDPDLRVYFDQNSVPSEMGAVADEPGWFVDNTRGIHDDGTHEASEAAARAPALKANKTAAMTLDCGNERHTQLVFWLTQTIDVSASQLYLDFFVDGELRETFARTFGWNRYVIDVPEGEHQYTFRAHATVDLATSFVIDTVSCVDDQQAEDPDLRVYFDDNSIPPEMGAVADEPGWFVDNTRGIHDDGTHEASEAAARVPALRANHTAAMTLDCGDETHTQLVFWLTQTIDVSASQLYLEFLVDGELRETLARTFGWNRYVVDVPRGRHEYTFRARATVDLPTSYVIDTVACFDVPPVASTDGRVDFDDDFVPPELDDNGTDPGFFVDNTRGIHDDGTHEASEAALRVPALTSGHSATATFDCGAYRYLTFYLNQTIDVSASVLGLDLLVNGALRTTYARTFGWNRFVIDGGAGGSHLYTFTAHSTADVAPPFVLDTFACSDTAPP